MDSITLKDKQFKPYLPAETIQQRVREMAAAINRDYADSQPLFLPILNGSFMFAADLFKHLTIECALSFVKIASYQGTTSSGQVQSLIGLNESLKGRDIILLEDIVDTGQTLQALLPVLEERNPRSVRIAVLLSKPESMEVDLSLDYVGFEIPNDFIVGYGLDYDGLGRNLPDIWQIVNNP